jgi:uncharacterized membrane protein
VKTVRWRLILVLITAPIWFVPAVLFLVALTFGALFVSDRLYYWATDRYNWMD